MNRDVRHLRYILFCIERNLEKLADTAGRLSEDVRNAAPHIAWRDVDDFRNILAHQYHGIDYEIVWSVIVNDLPPLKAFARTMLTQIEGATSGTTDTAQSKA